MRTKEEYEKLNRTGFEGDEFIAKRIEELCKKHSIDLILETGSRYGWTAKRLAAFAETHSCEMNATNYQIAKQNALDVMFYHMSSPKFLETMLALNKSRNILIYLDAHGPHTTPLLEELDEIAASGVKPVIVIHDFKVPDEPKLGYDTYNNQPYTWEWIEKHLHKIYGPACIRSYNSEVEAAGAMRGVVYIEPMTEHRLSFPEVREEQDEEPTANMEQAGFDLSNETPSPEFSLPNTDKPKKHKKK
jgi:hypothetical protein